MSDRRGSNWRKWDLHFHSQSSYDYKDKSVTDEELIAELIAKYVMAVAITDHHKIDETRIRNLQRLGQGKVLILPGIEFRSELGGSDLMHFIGIFPENCDINYVWKQLQVRCKIDDADIERRGGYDRTFCDFKETSKIIHELGGLVSVHAGKKSNSLERLKNDIKDDLEVNKCIDILEIGNVNDIEDYYRIVFPNIRRIIPIVLCSDNHNIKQYSTKQNLWIKADLTFEGLKQIIFEPEDRIRIQEINPAIETKKLVIDSIKIEDSDKYIISNESIVFNRDLVCIIGGRGSGKSALLESIAFCFDSDFKSDNPPSFIKFYQNIGAEARLTLNYLDLDGNVVEPYLTSIEEKNETPCSYPFFYINQNQIEKVATDKQYLHSLAFNTIITSSSLSEKMIATQDIIDELVKKIEDNFNKIITQKEIIKSIDQKSLEIETNRFKSELKLLESESTSEALKKLRVAQERRSTIIRAKKIEEDISDTLIRVEENLRDYFENLYSILDELGISYTPLVQYYTEINEHINNINIELDRLDNEEEYQRILLEVREMLHGNLTVSVEHIETLRKQISSNEALLKANKIEFDNYTNLLALRNQLLTKLESFINDYESTYKKAVNEFMMVNQDILGSLQFESELVFDTDALLINLLTTSVDRRKIKTIEGLREYLALPRNISFKEYIAWFKNFFTLDFEIEKYDVFYAGLANDIMKAFLLNHPRLSTKINYILDTVIKNIDQLSLGQKGTILLKLFLSSGNNCPIILDQPEDHLDNTFIYNDLVRTIRNAKKRRQIIVVTHNANLVVNGDAEQVIVAHYENEKINHLISGSLENPTIKEHVTSLLEGGIEAFIKREKKYQLKN
jgi:DNA repair protein SbcC/Rad50